MSLRIWPGRSCLWWQPLAVKRVSASLLCDQTEPRKSLAGILPEGRFPRKVFHVFELGPVALAEDMLRKSDRDIEERERERGERQTEREREREREKKKQKNKKLKDRRRTTNWERNKTLKERTRERHFRGIVPRFSGGILFMCLFSPIRTDTQKRHPAPGQSPNFVYVYVLFIAEITRKLYFSVSASAMKKVSYVQNNFKIICVCYAAPQNCKEQLCLHLLRKLILK